MHISVDKKGKDNKILLGTKFLVLENYHVHLYLFNTCKIRGLTLFSIFCLFLKRIFSILSISYFLPFSQCVPVNPSGHLHTYAVLVLIDSQVPPFLQGLDWQGLLVPV